MEREGGGSDGSHWWSVISDRKEAVMGFSPWHGMAQRSRVSARWNGEMAQIGSPLRQKGGTTGEKGWYGS